MSSLSPTLLHTSCPKQSDLKVVLIEIPCVLQKGKEEAGPQMLRDKVEEGSWPGPRRRPGTGEGLCKSSLFEQPTKRQREGRANCATERKWTRESSHASAPPSAPTPRVASNTSSTALWILKVQPPNGPINADENESDSSLSSPPVCWLNSLPHSSRLPVNVATLFHCLFLALISEALIRLGIGWVSRAPHSAVKGSLSSSSIQPLQTEHQCEPPHAAAASSLAQPACSLCVAFSAGHPMQGLGMVET